VRVPFALGAVLTILPGCSSHFAPLPEWGDAVSFVAFRPENGAEVAAYFARSLPADDFVLRATQPGQGQVQILQYQDPLAALGLEVVDGLLVPDPKGTPKEASLGIPLPSPARVFGLEDERFEALPKALGAVTETLFRVQPCARVHKRAIPVAQLGPADNLELIVPWTSGVLVGVGAPGAHRAYFASATQTSSVALQHPGFGEWVGGPGRGGAALALGANKKLYRLSPGGQLSEDRDLRELIDRPGVFLKNVAESEGGLLAVLGSQGEVWSVDAGGAIAGLGRAPDNLSNCDGSGIARETHILGFDAFGELTVVFESGRIDSRSPTGVWNSTTLPDPNVCSSGRVLSGADSPALVSYGLSSGARAQIVERTSEGWKRLLEDGDLLPGAIGRLGARVFAPGRDGTLFELRSRTTVSDHRAWRCPAQIVESTPVELAGRLLAFVQAEAALAQIVATSTNLLVLEIFTAADQ